MSDEDSKKDKGNAGYCDTFNPPVQENRLPDSRTEKTGAVLCLDMIYQFYSQGEHVLNVLQGASLTILPGQSVALIGSSGSGKSTLLHIAGLLEKPARGRVVIKGEDTHNLADTELSRMRRCKIGFIYQSHRLMSDLSALENVILPQRIAGLDLSEARKRARQLLAMVGLSERMNHRPAELSGGEQQRVAIARSVANVPYLLLADEPTGNLDSKNASRVFSILWEIIRQSELAILIATHDNSLASRADRRVILNEGIIRDV